MTSRRRYTPIKDYPVYSKEFDRLRILSPILNQDSRPSVHTIFFNKRNIETELEKISDVKTKGSLPNLKDQLKTLEFRFDNLKRDCRKQGYQIPDKIPIDILNERYRIEAQIDVVLEEKEQLEVMLKTMSDKVVKELSVKMLLKGLFGVSHNHGFRSHDPDLIDQMAEIDGQNVSMCPAGILIVDDEASIYNGLAISDYRKLCKIWTDERYRADAELLIKMQKEARLQGQEVPTSTGHSFNRNVSRSDLPKFPTWAKHYSMSDH